MSELAGGEGYYLPIGELGYEFTRWSKPALCVMSGATLTVETEDAFNGQVRAAGDTIAPDTSLYNPLSGPIAVLGAHPGDMLAVEIHSIEPLLGHCLAVAMRLPASAVDSQQNELSTSVRICPIEEGSIWWSDCLRIPYSPMVGCIGTAPSLGVPTSLPAGDHGGNLDLTAIGVDATIYLPVYVEGGLLYLGDCHAAQGEGEVGGIGLDMPGRVTFQLHVIKDHRIPGPRIQTCHELMAVATGRTLEDAIIEAYWRLTLWLENDFGINRKEGWSLLTQIGALEIGHVHGGAVAAKVSRTLIEGTNA